MELLTSEELARALAFQFGYKIVTDIHRLAIEEILAAGGLGEAAEDVHEGTLAATGGTHDGDELTGLDADAHARQCGDGSVAEVASALAEARGNAYEAQGRTDEASALYDRAVEILGGKEEDYLGREMVSLVDPVDRYFVRRRWEMMERDRSSINMTVRLKKPGGVSEWFAFHFETAQPESGERRLARIEHVALSGTHDW